MPRSDIPKTITERGVVIGFTGGRHSWPGHADLLTEAGAETVIKRWADLPRVAEAVMAWEGLSE